MYFNGGLIPTYIWVAKYLKMYNSYLALIIPGLVSVFYIIVIRTQIEQIPESLTEAAIIDGANQFQVLFKIVIPAIKPTIAAICMFLILGKWNGWFDVLVYIRDKEKWMLQYYLREIVFTATFSGSSIWLQLNSTVQLMYHLKTSKCSNYPCCSTGIMCLSFCTEVFCKGYVSMIG